MIDLMERSATEDLRQYFAGRLPARIFEVEEARDAARAAGWSGEPLRTFHRLAHSLAGAGATFGFPEVTTLARRLESLLKTALAEGAPSGEVASREVDRLLDRLSPFAAGHPSAPEEPSGAAAAPERILMPQDSEERLLYLWSDNVGFHDALELQLQPFGYEIRAFAQLETLEREAHRHPPYAVLLDWQGPGAGPDTQRIAALGRTNGETLKRVFLSPQGNLAARLEAVRAGGDAYLTKPVEDSLLAETLERLTGRSPEAPYRVVIVEDDADLATLYARALEAAGMSAAVVSDPMEVMGPLTQAKPDVILMDLYMPGCTGPELAAVLRQQDGYVGVPIVYLSTEEGLEEQLAAISAGGDEFLTKPIAPDHLVAAVMARARRGRLLTTHIAHDGLTGLLNHSHLKQQIEIELTRAGREGLSVAYAMVDLDRFKSINDVFGHAAGDRLLKSLAQLLRQRLRRSDVLGRYGGDEFAVLLPHTDGPSAVQVLDEIRDSFCHLRPSVGDREMAATLSCGVAVYPSCPTAAELVETADAALYEAKRSGRNRIVLRS
ncbi:MAG TPA: diguanylate cyclase [Thermoanaerobaculia bacterium]|jgi:diguanylate cyclase (GGDEF)-like protein|nr:diguanylate cyclase [Thermoanaerobaculia bacterium]